MNYQQTQREHAPITFDPADFTGICRIMDTHGDSEVPFFGRNGNGEDTCLSVCHDKALLWPQSIIPIASS